MDIQKEREAFESWCVQWNIAHVFPLDEDGQYREYEIHLLYCAWLQGQAAKAQAVPEIQQSKQDDIDDLKAQLKAAHESRADFVGYHRTLEND